ncbi:MAG TPA: hypothetical protein VGI19_17720 [Candidatus Cybelea sp.]
MHLRLAVRLGGVEFWHYRKGGNPFKMYPTTDEIAVLAVNAGE